MRNYKTKGIVLKTFKLGEADKIITLITERQGKVSAVAKGVRRTKSRFGARLEPFTNLNLIIYRGRGLSTITNADIIRIYDGVTGSLDRINYGYAMLELVEKLSVEEQGDPRVYNMLAIALDYLSRIDEGKRLVLSTFDIKLLAFSGFLPNINECVVCSDKSAHARFSFTQGGVLCAGCSNVDPSSINLKTDSIRLMRELLFIPFKELRSVKTDTATLGELNNIIHKHMEYHMNIRLKVRKFIDRSEKEDSLKQRV